MSKKEEIMKSHKLRSIVLTFILASLTINCLAKREKNEPPPDPKFAIIERITLLPIVDARVDKKVKLNLNTGILPLRTIAGQFLRTRHYKVTLGNSEASIGELALADLQEAKPSFIKQLGQPSDRWVMILVVTDTSSKAVQLTGRQGSATLLGFLFDKEAGILIWDGTSEGDSFERGLINLGDKKGTEYNAGMYAIDRLFKSLPKQEKK